MLTYLGLGESLSKHPIAESIVRKVKKDLGKTIKTKEIKMEGVGNL